MIRSKRLLKICVLVFLVCFSFSCDKKDAKLLKIDRFDANLYEVLRNPDDTVLESAFLAKYADFIPLYIQGVLGDHLRANERPIGALRRFFSDSTLMKVYADEQNAFRDVSKYENQLSESVNRFREWYPNDSMPEFRLHLSGLSQSVVTSGSLVSVAGDKYLGQDYALYKSFFYDYQLQAMQTGNLVRDALRAYLESRFPEENSQDLLDRMIYKGAILVAVEHLLPEISQAELLSYSPKEMEWLKSNEKNIWMYMVENEQLYTSDQLTLVKYMEEAPFTSYFGEESPSRIGVFEGYNIVKKYIDKRNVKINKLLEHIDAKIILTESGYRP